MHQPIRLPSHNLYETDYLKWIETTIAQLEFENYSAVDWQNLIEEIRDIGRNERRSLENNLVVVLMHLLKWQYQPEMRSGSWRGSITEHRRRIQRALKDSPSLKPYLEEIFSECYFDAVRQAADETGLARQVFPEGVPYSIAATLDFDFLPE